MTTGTLQPSERPTATMPARESQRRGARESQRRGARESQRRGARDLAPLPALVGAVERALLARGALEATVLAAAVLGSAALVCALAVPALPRWPWLIALPLAPLVGAWRARRAIPAESDLVLFIDRRLAGNEARVRA